MHTLLDVYREFELIIPVTDTLLKVRSGEKYGLFSLKTMEAVVPVECEEVEAIDPDHIAIRKGEQHGMFSIETSELTWELQNRSS